VNIRVFEKNPVARLSSALLLVLAASTASTTSAAPARDATRALRLPAPVADADFYDHGAPAPEKVELGRLLMHDKILSGNLNISCATCHHSLTDTGDGLSLPVGEGGRGTGVIRNTAFGTADRVPERVPRNAPPVFNLGAREFVRMFHDGRLEVDPGQPSGFSSPAGDDLPLGLDNVLAAQAMFPVTSGTEMAGQVGENAVADAAAASDLAGPEGVWELLARRLRAIPAYVELFKSAYPGQVTSADDISFVLAANAIAAFEAVAWRADSSPFDHLLRGDASAMSPSQRRGMHVFYQHARCVECHSGPFQSDHDFHAIAMPQIGPGKGDGASGLEDHGRYRVTQQEQDLLRFRTPSLRNVSLTGPWGHAGAYDDLRAVVVHHLDAVAGLYGYDPAQAVLPPDPDFELDDFEVLHDGPAMQAIADANELDVISLRPSQIDDLLAFLQALTDETSLDLRSDIPMQVPSGLPVAD
jgi:cytochrome c peroxidase